VSVTLPEGLVALLRRPAPCFVATVMPDGSPQLTETWVDTDGEHIVINVIDGMQKARNVARDPRVAVNVTDPDQPARYWGVRGHVVETTTAGGAEHIEELSQRYLGRPYPNFGGPGRSRLIIRIAADSIAHAPEW
jgi:PPOX class probable F420-dependent enzyme